MTTTAWIDGDSDFGTAANWSDGVPVPGEDAEIVGTENALLTVTVATSPSAGAYTAQTLNTEFATLNVIGATLTLQRASLLDAVDQSGGTLIFANSGTGSTNSVLTGTVSMAGGVLEIQTGSVTLTGIATLANSVIGGGTLVTDAGAELDGLVLGDGSTLDNRGIDTVTLGTLNLGFNAEFSAAGMLNEAGAVFLILGDGGIASPGDLGTFTNAGLFEKQVGIDSTVEARFVSVGAISVDTGALIFAGSGSTYAGEIDGSGTVDFAASSQTWEAGLTLDVDDVRVSTAITLAANLTYGGSLDASNSQINLTNFALTLTTAANLDNTLATNGGTLVTQSVQAVDSLTIGDGATLENQGTETIGAGTLELGFSNEIFASALLNAAGATFEFLGDGGIAFPTGSAAIFNTGLFQKIGGTGTSTISATFHNTGTISVDTGTLQLSSGVTNDGSAGATDGGSLTFAGSLAADIGKTGVVALASHGSGTFEGSVSASETIGFADDTGRVLLRSASQFAASIEGFQGTDTLSDAIDLLGLTGLSKSYAGDPSSGLLTLKQGDVLKATLKFVGDYSTNSFTLTGDGADGTLITATTAPCYCHGTHILTEHGELAVEGLRVGDRVFSVLCGALLPINWIGSRQVDCTSHPIPHDVWPVRVCADAFGDGLPRRDLWLSPDHAVFVDNVLIPIRYLVNGRTVVQERRDEVTYWHVELDQHDVILAEGLPCESYLDTGNRHAFANGGAAVQLHPDFALKGWHASAGSTAVAFSGRA